MFMFHIGYSIVSPKEVGLNLRRATALSYLFSLANDRAFGSNNPLKLLK